MHRSWLLAFLLLAGCRTPDPYAFPIGIFGVETPEQLSTLSSKGFNAFQAYSWAPVRLLPLIDEARRSGSLLLISPWELMSSSNGPRGIRGPIWYLQDEPDVHRIDAAKLAEMDRRVRSWAPGSRTAFVVGDGRSAARYPDIADVIMVDWYPVPHLPLHSLGDHVRWTREAAGKRPVWAVIQAMDWRNFPQRDPKKPRIGRFPDIGEMRFMSYDAVFNGASGLWYFTFTISEGEDLSARPEELFALVSVAREMRSMANVFAYGAPVPTETLGELKPPLAAMARRYKGKDYLILLNRSPKPQPLPASIPLGWRQLFYGHRDVSEWGVGPGSQRKAPVLKGYDVLVLEGRTSLRSRLASR